MDQTTRENRPNLLWKLPMRLHHHAYTTDDHERNRQFYEDVLGLPLVAMYVEREFLEGDWVELGHAFYGLGDGSALAFFNMADPVKQAAMRAKEQSIFVHISFLVEQSTQDEIRSRVTAAGIEPFVLDHGFCVSLYVKDPNGLLLEFTVDTRRLRRLPMKWRPRRTTTCAGGCAVTGRSIIAGAPAGRRGRPADRRRASG